MILIVRLAQHGLFFAAEAVFCRYTAVKGASPPSSFAAAFCQNPAILPPFTVYLQDCNNKFIF
ncbi:MAG: hypothetical protein V8T36_05650 [Ruthenibacterium lactatiformans]